MTGPLLRMKTPLATILAQPVTARLLQVMAHPLLHLGVLGEALHHPRIQVEELPLLLGQVAAHHRLAAQMVIPVHHQPMHRQPHHSLRNWSPLRLQFFLTSKPREPLLTPRYISWSPVLDCAMSNLSPPTTCPSSTGPLRFLQTGPALPWIGVTNRSAIFILTCVSWHGMYRRVKPEKASKLCRRLVTPGDPRQVCVQNIIAGRVRTVVARWRLDVI